MAGKEAVAFIIDASASMASTYPSVGTVICTGANNAQPEHHSPSQEADPMWSQAAAELEEELMDSVEGALDSALEGGVDSGDMCSKEWRAPTQLKTRLDVAKEACLSMVTDLVLQSKANECSVVVCKAGETRHHLCAEEQVEDGTACFPNILELAEMARPTVDLMREIRALKPSGQKGDKSGDLWDGIVVASDALFRRTKGKKYRRRLIIFTDAEHEVHVDDEQLLGVVDGLRNLEAIVTVIGLDFVSSATFGKAATEADAEAESGDGEDEDLHSQCHSADAEGGDDAGASESERMTIVKEENEKLLNSLTRLTGGSVIAASTLRQLLDSTCGRRIPKSSRRNMEFNIAPGLTVQAKYSLLLSKQNLKSLKKEAVLVGSNGVAMKNSLGEDMMTGVTFVTSHWDADDADVEVTLEKRTQAFKYGSSLIPIGGFDMEGLKMRAPVSLTVLGYVRTEEVPRTLFIGDPYGVSGGESRQASAAISALSHGLHIEDCAALCKFVKSKDADPLLGAIFPLIEDEAQPPRRLYFVQLPFAKDLQILTMQPLDDVAGSNSRAQICDDLIDSLMLPDECMNHEKVPNPAVRSFNKTLIERSIDPSADIATTRSKATNSSMSEDTISTPSIILKKAEEKIDLFLNSFKLQISEGAVTNAPKSKRKTWSYGERNG